MKQKLKIGLLTDSDSIPAWSHKMLERINNSDHSDVVIVIKKDQSELKKSSFFSKLWENKNDVLWIVYCRLENILYKPQPNAFKVRNIKELIDCDELVVETKKQEISDCFLQSDVDKIKQYDIDVLINLCFISLTGDILTTPKYGIWSYCHSDRSINRGGPSGAWEVFKQIDETGVVLEIMSEDIDEGKILAKSYSSTEKLSINRNRNNIYWKALSFIPRKLNELHKLGEVQFFENVNDENSNIDFFYNDISKKPTNWQVLKAFLKIYSKKIIFSFKSLFYYNQWIILYQFNNDNQWATQFHRFERMTPPKDRIWADPFVIKKYDKYYIFLEELVHSERYGKISVSEIDDNGNYSKPITIIQKDYHMSYPFLIEDEGELYMIPETSQDNTIQLYKCMDFPLKWEFVKVLMDDVSALDSTIFKHNGKYWLFTNIKENEGASSMDELFLFYSDSLTEDEWVSHPLNPIISDVRHSRPAGKIFIENGKMFRPSQNCASHYGHGMKINEIVELTTTSYREVIVQSIYPNWSKDLVSTHTINKYDNLTIIDALRRRHK